MSQNLFVIIAAGLRLVGLWFVAHALIALCVQVAYLGIHGSVLPIVIGSIVPVVGGVLAWILSKPIAALVMTGIE